MPEGSSVDDQLAAWLEPVTVNLTPDELGRRRAGVAELVAQLTRERSEGLVCAGHRYLDPETTEWLATCIQKHDPAFSREGKAELLSVLACAGMVEILTQAASPQAARVALLVESARFLGLEAAVPLVQPLARPAIDTLVSESRGRSVVTVSHLVSVQKLLEPAPPAEGQPAATLTPEESLALSRAASEHLAKALEGATKAVQERFDLLDEELNTLWWSYARRSAELDVAWRDVKPVERRIAVAARELNDCFTKSGVVPSTTRSLLAIALDDGVAKEVTVGSVVEAMASEQQNPPGGADGRLVPFGSALRQLQSLGRDDETWRTVALRTRGVDCDRKVKALDAAEQLLNEYRLGGLP